MEADLQPPGVLALGVAHGKRQRAGAGGHGDQVDGIRHQPGSEDAHVAVGGMPGQEGELGLAVFAVKEEIAPKVAALRDGVRAAHGHHASNTCHRKDSGSTGGKFPGTKIT